MKESYDISAFVKEESFLIFTPVSTSMKDESYVDEG